MRSRSTGVLSFYSSWTPLLSLCNTAAAATPMAVKREHEPLEGVNDTPPRMADLNATPSCGKENADTFHRLSALQVGKDSSPNTLAAEVAAIAGITALTQVNIKYTQKK